MNGISQFMADHHPATVECSGLFQTVGVRGGLGPQNGPGFNGRGGPFLGQSEGFPSLTAGGVRGSGNFWKITCQMMKKSLISDDPTNFMNVFAKILCYGYRLTFFYKFNFS